MIVLFFVAFGCNEQNEEDQVDPQTSKDENQVLANNPVITYCPPSPPDTVCEEKCGGFKIVSNTNCDPLQVHFEWKCELQKHTFCYSAFGDASKSEIVDGYCDCCNGDIKCAKPDIISSADMYKIRNNQQFTSVYEDGVDTINNAHTCVDCDIYDDDCPKKCCNSEGYAVTYDTAQDILFVECLN